MLLTSNDRIRVWARANGYPVPMSLGGRAEAFPTPYMTKEESGEGAGSEDDELQESSDEQ
jgi:hypothetical protein